MKCIFNFLCKTFSPSFVSLVFLTAFPLFVLQGATADYKTKRV